MLDRSTKKKEDRMCKIAIRNAGMTQYDIARVLNVSQSAVSRPLKERRESGSITKRKRSTLILVYLLDFFCSGIQFNLLLSPYPCFISLLYLDLYVLGDDALIS